jgi:hypothetical protein
MSIFKISVIVLQAYRLVNGVLPELNLQADLTHERNLLGVSGSI